MAPRPENSQHFCEWRDYAETVEVRLGEMEQRIAQLERRLFGKSSEKMPAPAVELKNEQEGTDPAQKQQRRRANRERKAAISQRVIFHAVPPERRVCPCCHGTDLRPLGDGRKTVLFERIPAVLEQQVHVQEVLACRCGKGIVVAEAPARVVDKSPYGPQLVASIIVGKCAQSLPLYRQEKELRWQGIPISRSTLTDLFHRSAEQLRPLYERLLVLIAMAEVVQADETTLRVLAAKQCRKAWMWTFRHRNLIAYKFSASRSGTTPQQVLGASSGVLVVDGYTGYNRVVALKKRQRAGCWAHCRRKFFDALGTAPVAARAAMDMILDLYRVEHAALEQGVVRTGEHLRLRQQHSRPVLDKLHAWLRTEQALHPPKGPMGVAIHYALDNWAELQVFANNVNVPLDNNASEAALRIVAVGRKNFLFVGNDEAGDNLAVLYSLVATCEASGVNPQDYLADVLMRVQTHPASQIDDLLPHRWTPSPAAAAA